jgi:hypothetical protein
MTRNFCQKHRWLNQKNGTKIENKVLYRVYTELKVKRGVKYCIQNLIDNVQRISAKDEMFVPICETTLRHIPEEETICNVCF